MEFLIVGIGGFCGAIARYFVYLVERSILSHHFPFGTVFINVSGCLLAGLLLATGERALPIHRHLILIGSMGFIGSFTTFSTYSVETLQLFRSGQTGLAGINVIANTVIGIGAVWIGRYLSS